MQKSAPVAAAEAGAERVLAAAAGEAHPPQLRELRGVPHRDRQPRAQPRRVGRLVHDGVLEVRGDAAGQQLPLSSAVQQVAAAVQRGLQLLVVAAWPGGSSKKFTTQQNDLRCPLHEQRGRLDELRSSHCTSAAI